VRASHRRWCRGQTQRPQASQAVTAAVPQNTQYMVPASSAAGPPPSVGADRRYWLAAEQPHPPVGLAILAVSLVPRRLHFLEQLLDRLVDRLSVVGPDTLPADDALGVEDVQRRPGVEIPPRGNRPVGVAAVPERPPGDL